MVPSSTIPGRNEIWKCWYLRRGENRSTQRKTSRSKGKNQQQTQPTCDVDAGIWTRATLVGGECSHHCAIPCSPRGISLQRILHNREIKIHVHAKRQTWVYTKWPSFPLYYIHFEITGYPCNLIGSQQCDLFLNRTIFCTKSHLFQIASFMF